MKMLVTGGTGTLGRVLVERLLADGHDVTVASRRTRPDEAGAPGDAAAPGWATVDWRTGAGLEPALADADTVVHCAYSYRGIDVERRLVDAARRAGDPHVVFVSIVGIDRVPYLFYRLKLAAERLLEDSGLPWTVLRATQFHDLVRGLLAVTARSPLMPVPDIPIQPIDVTDVAARLAVLAAGEPVGRAADIGGPEVYNARDLAETYLRVTGLRRTVLPFRLPGKPFRALREGSLLTPENAVGTVTFEQYLHRLTDPAATSYRGAR